jgi:flagellar hook-associated protein 1 FlgK
VSIPTLQGLQTALSGLLADQQAIDVTGQNITNANTEGYSRQRAILVTNEPMRIAALSPTNGEGAQLGTGVGVAGYTRIRNTYLDAQYRTQNTALGAANTDVEELQQAQGAFDEPSSAGLSSQLSAFWSAWSELAVSPSEAAKVGVVSTATQLTDTLHQLDSQLQSIEGQAAAQYTAITGPSGQVSSDASQIAELNQQIKLSIQAHQQPNDLEDRRDLLIDKLSSLASVTVTKETDGTDTITFGNAAQPLVEKSTVHWPQALTAAAGGQLGALLDLSSPAGALASYQTALNEVAELLSTSVNALHKAPPFFKGAGAAGLEVAVTAAEVQTSSSGNPGGNNIAQEIADLRGGAAEQRYSALVEQIGAGVQNAQQSQTTAQAVVTTLSNQRQAVSGVSLDEEMTNLVTFQRGYQASARALTMMDEMLDTLINHTGTAGM